MSTIMIDTITIPGAPDIPGLIFRPFRDESDFVAMADVTVASLQADQIDRFVTPDILKRFYLSRAIRDPARDTILVEVNGEVIGCNSVFTDTTSDGVSLYWHMGHVVPEWRRRGIGRTLLRHGEQRLRAIAATQPWSGPRYFEAEAADTQPGNEALLRRAGYIAVRHLFEMTRPLNEEIAEAPLPEGLEVRPAQPEHDLLVLEANNEAFQDHWSFIPVSVEQAQQYMQRPDVDRRYWRVAWDGDTVVGVTMSRINTDEHHPDTHRRGWIENVSVRRAWRGRGVARALMTQSLILLKGYGMTEAALEVDTENLTGALRLYESIKFHPVQRSSIYRKPLV